MRLAAELLPDPREERYKFEPPIAKLYVYPPVTRDSVLPQIIYACHSGKLKQESRAVAGKPRDAAAVLFSLKFAVSQTTFITSLRVAKLRKPGFRAPNIPA